MTTALSPRLDTPPLVLCPCGCERPITAHPHGDGPVTERHREWCRYLADNGQLDPKHSRCAR